MIRSLWIKLVGALVLINLISLAVILSLVTRATEQEFGRYTDARLDTIEQIVTTRMPAVPGIRDDEIGIIVPREDGIDGSTRDGESISTITEGQERLLTAPDIRSIVVEVAADPGNDSQFLIDTRKAATVAIAITGTASILIGAVLIRQITRPLEKLRSTVNRYAQGDLGARTSLKSSDEVGRLAAAFNNMAEELEKQEIGRKQMVADVAHELRTPLAIMRGNVEAMQDGLLQPDQEELAGLESEIGRLTRLIDDLRLLSQADAGMLALNKEAVEVEGFINRLATLMKPRAEDASVMIRTQMDTPGLSIIVDADRLQQALINLLDNAIRNSPPGGVVAISGSSQGDMVRLSISDSGPGIPEADRPYIFDRFWRGDKSRSRGSGGSGLGLSIVKQIIELHGGSVYVDTLDKKGCRFVVDLPVST